MSHIFLIKKKKEENLFSVVFLHARRASALPLSCSLLNPLLTCRSHLSAGRSQSGRKQQGQMAPFCNNLLAALPGGRALPSLLCLSSQEEPGRHQAGTASTGLQLGWLTALLRDPCPSSRWVASRQGWSSQLRATTSLSSGFAPCRVALLKFSDGWFLSQFWMKGRASLHAKPCWMKGWGHFIPVSDVLS